MVAIVCLSVFAVLFGTNKTYSSFVSVIVPDGDEVSVYVSGNDVEKVENSKNYNVTPGSTITVTVVNESRLFKSISVNGGEPTYSPVLTVTVPDSGRVKITVETEDPYAEDKGKYFGNPYLLSKEADVLAVARILKNGVATAEDLAQIGAASTTTAEDIRYGYYRLATNLFISNSEFFGLGFRGGLPFGGCFDFDGYAATINIVRTERPDKEFTKSGDVNQADYGFFGYAYGDGKRPCLMRNLKLQGFVGINTMQSGETVNHGDVVNVGGVAGVAGKNIVFDGIQSTVSVSVQTRFASLYIGGIFGICSSSVEEWCDINYDGAFNDVSGVTYGENARAIVGGFAGVIHNASINGVMIDAEQSMVLANALGRVSGSAIAGGFAGIIELGASSAVEISNPRPLIIKNVTIYAEKDYSVSAVIDNSDSADKANIAPDDFTSSSAAAIAGGIIGTVDRGRAGAATVGADCTIEFSDIFFERSRQNITGEDAVTEGSGRVSVTASTQDGGSSGAVFAGGAIGYIFSISADYVLSKTADEQIKYFFDCSVDVSAVQNGTGPAYAGGAFGYNAIRAVSESGQTAVTKRGIVSPGNDYTVTAVQSATSSKTGNKFYNVCAGGYSSRFSTGYQLKDMTFYVGSGRITAYREVGSTAVGDVNAGGLVGRVLGFGNAATTINQYEKSPSQSGSLENITVYYTGKSRIEASCYSFSSINASGDLGNNVCAGGAIGYVLGYSRINGLSVIFENDSSSSGKAAEYFVSGVQNAKNNAGGDAGLKSEGFVGGAFGLVIDTQISDVNVIGDAAEKSVVYFTSSNSPNTASVGGIVGTLSRRKIASGTTLLNGATVKNLHVAGRAYSESNYGDTYDLYSGGAIGVFAITQGSIKITIKNIDVSDCIIDSVGEKAMLTYSGGVVGGMWWTGNTVLYYATVRNCAVTASSISWNAYAGGIVGLMQSSDIAYCLTQNTEVKAISEQLNAYAAGIAARARAGSDNIKYSYSNASLKAQGKTGSTKYGIIATMDKASDMKDKLTDATANFFVYETAGVRKAHQKDTDNTRALYLYNNTQNAVSIASNQTVGVYSAITTNQSSTMTIKSHSDAATVSGDGLSVTGKKPGVAYVSAYCKIAYPAENGSAAVTKEFLLCSYPVTVDAYSESGAGLILKTDDGKPVTADKCDALVSYNTGSANYVYFRRNVGNPATVNKINVFPDGAEYLPQSLKFYDITTVTEAKYDDTDDINSRIKAIINAKGASCDVSSFNGRASVGYNYSSEGDVGAAKKSVYFYANDNARENTIILMECKYGTYTYGVIVEFVPNQLESIEVSPESTTPPLGVSKDADGITHYIYTAGDVARFGATLHYHYPAPRSYVVETIYEGNGVTPNGTVKVAAGGYYTIVCRDIKGNKRTTFVVEAKTEVAFSFQYLGSTGSSDRKMVESSAFSFRTEPQPGYGLNPAVSITVNGVTALGTLSEGKITFDFGNGKVFDFSAKRDSADGYSYAFVAGSDFVDYAAANGKSAVFSAEYKKIYSLVFIANYGGNDFFPVTVAAGEKFSSVTPDGFAAWLNGIKNNRYGYDFKGFYSVSKAGDVSAYGKSFEDMQKDGSAISGTMRFYARWTYNITVDAPEGVNVTSSMPRSMLEENSNIIPLDANVGFGFVISAADGWCGKPRYNAFIRKENGTYEDITPLFTAASLENGYFISFEEIEKRGSGYIYLKIYADDLEFAVGDDPKYDGSSLYTDGIFTVTYNVNYGSEDTVADFAFDFGTLALPAGTSMRLFYQKNGSPTWAGSRVLTTAENKISVGSFISMKDGTSFADVARDSAVTEKFALVVTLPNNTNGFGITAATGCSVKVNNYAYKSVIKNYGLFERTGESPDTSVYHSVKDFTLLPAVIKTVVYDNGVFTFSETGTLDANVIDRRHSGVYYAWRIEKVGGGYIGTEKFSSFGKESVRTTDAVYYLATKGSIRVTEDLRGYKVSLIEIKNVQQPAEGLTIFSKSF